jgi:microsomal dipeptidase-like Zn-dependent dipeptidase
MYPPECIRNRFVFDLHGHLDGLFPPAMREANKDSMPRDFAISELSSDKLNGFVVTVLGDPDVFGLSQEARDQYVLRRLEVIRAKATSASVPIVVSSQSLSSAGAANSCCLVLGIEGADFLDEELSLLGTVYELGVRVLQFVHYGENAFGSIGLGWGGRIPEPNEHTGLTPKGRELCRRCNERGIMVDLSHADEETLSNALDESEAPVMVSHTGPRALQSGFPRYISDKAMRRVANNGGLIGLWLFRLGSTGIASLSDFQTYLAHCIDVVGADHIGVGTDINGVPSNANGYENPHDFPAIVEAMQQARVSDRDVEKIIGTNFIRFMRDVESRSKTPA